MFEFQNFRFGFQSSRPFSITNETSASEFWWDLLTDLWLVGKGLLKPLKKGGRTIEEVSVEFQFSEQCCFQVSLRRPKDWINSRYDWSPEIREMHALCNNYKLFLFKKTSQYILKSTTSLWDTKLLQEILRRFKMKLRPLNKRHPALPTVNNMWPIFATSACLFAKNIR